ncbi:Ig-like domain-containing protein [Marinicrinis sediminis]|uniref:Ig-like domain-containing protein n=1 Tax=Marinicrinis sediminis TaxID=1652465 RepID=A0ABW5R9G5_9BACL
MTDRTQEPMIKLQPGGTAPILSYNVPEPTTYSGRNFIDMQFPASYYVSSANQVASIQASPALSGPVISRSAERLLADAGIQIPSEHLEQMSAEGKKVHVYRNVAGGLKYAYHAAKLGEEPAFAAVSARVIEDNETPPFDPMRPRDNEDPDPIPDPEPTSIGIHISSPAANASMTGPHTGAKLDVTGSVQIYSGGGTITKVQVQVGAGKGYLNAALSGGTWALYNHLVTTPGPIAITARATHSDGTTADHTITVHISLLAEPDTTLPVLKITAPVAGSVFSAKGKPTTSITVEGTASDNKGVQKVELALDAGAYTQADPVSGWSSWKKTLAVSPGLHAIHARCTDMSGNVSSASISVHIDATPPQVTITSPVNSAHVSGSYNQGALIEVNGTAMDAHGIEKVELSVDHRPIFVEATALSPDWKEWTGSVVITEPGLHFITARCTDVAKNVVETTIAVQVQIIPEITSRLKRLILVESYRLSSFTGNYGAGMTFKTFSLLPGEKTKISIKTYKQNEETAKSASCILDSVSDEIADTFETMLGNEQSDKRNYDESFEYKVAAEAGASWGWGQASVEASVSGGTNASREEFAKNISNATQKHVATASSRRNMEVKSDYEVKSTESEEVSTVREIENINMSRTLNFVFRQMNQEYISILHLVDVRIGYFTIDIVNGVEEPKYKEVTLPQLDSLLKEAIVPERIKDVRNSILHQLANIFDYQDRHHCFVEEEAFQDADGTLVPFSSYLRIKKNYYSEYKLDPDAESGIKVPGIIMAANRHVLRTDGIIVEAVLGQGEALDDYSKKLQEETIREKDLRNDLLYEEIRMKRQANEILKSKDEQAAHVYSLLQPVPKAEEEEEDSNN